MRHTLRLADARYVAASLLIHISSRHGPPHAVHARAWPSKEPCCNVSSGVQVRGVHSATDRQQLVAAAFTATPPTPSSAALPREQQHAQAAASQTSALPGVRTLWDLNSGRESGRTQALLDIAVVSRRLVELASLLGSSVSCGRVRIADMVLREPRLLTADLGGMMQRLLALRVKLSGHSDTIELIEQHPNLLLDDSDGARCVSFCASCVRCVGRYQVLAAAYSPAPAPIRLEDLRVRAACVLQPCSGLGVAVISIPGGMSNPIQTARLCRGQRCRGLPVENLMPALSHGIASDTSSEWESRLQELQQYCSRHGDVHCGFREDDDRGLARWCKKQRTSYRRGALNTAAKEALRATGFMFDADCAEWHRWYNELVAFKAQYGSTEAGAHTAHEAFYLRNWCSVQRVARRSGVLQSQRIRLLDELGFNWSAPDPLS